MRLNDTRAIVDTPLKESKCSWEDDRTPTRRGSNPFKPLRAPAGERGTVPACPDAGEAVTARRALPGVMQYSYEGDSMDRVGHSRPHPDAGSETLRSATMYLKNGKL